MTRPADGACALPAGQPLTPTTWAAGTARAADVRPSRDSAVRARTFGPSRTGGALVVARPGGILHLLYGRLDDLERLRGG